MMVAVSGEIVNMLEGEILSGPEILVVKVKET